MGSVKEEGFLYKETSAVTGENVDDAFMELSKELLRRAELGEIESDDIKPRLLNPISKSSEKDSVK